MPITVTEEARGIEILPAATYKPQCLVSGFSFGYRRVPEGDYRTRVPALGHALLSGVSVGTVPVVGLRRTRLGHEEDRRFADGQFLGYLTDGCQRRRWRPSSRSSVTSFQCHSATRDLAVDRLDDLGGFPNCQNPGQAGRERRGLVWRREAGRQPRAVARWRWWRPSAGRSGGWGRRCRRRQPPPLTSSNRIIRARPRGGSDYSLARPWAGRSWRCYVR
jgi:hypothetical protein